LRTGTLLGTEIVNMQLLCPTVDNVTVERLQNTTSPDGEDLAATVTEPANPLRLVIVMGELTELPGCTVTTPELATSWNPFGGLTETTTAVVRLTGVLAAVSVKSYSPAVVEGVKEQLSVEVTKGVVADRARKLGLVMQMGGLRLGVRVARDTDNVTVPAKPLRPVTLIVELLENPG